MKFAAICLLSVVACIPAAAVDPAPLPKAMESAKTIYIENQGVEDVIMDNLYDKLSKWKRWTVVNDPKEADVVAILSRQDAFYGMLNTGSTATGSATATTYGNTTIVSGQARTNNSQIPIFSFNRYLTLFDNKTGQQLVSVQSDLRLKRSATAGKLMDKLKGRFPKAER